MNNLTAKYFENDNTLLENAINNIEMKIHVIQKPNRTKRGLLNGLGTVIKSITGNLDQEDKENYDKILNTIRSNQGNIINNMNEQIKINQNFTKQFNTQIQLMNKNNELIEMELKSMNVAMKQIYDEMDIIAIHQIYQNLLTLSNQIYLSLLQIEETLSFCSLNTLYFGLISREEINHYINGNTEGPMRILLKENYMNNKILKTVCYLNSKLEILIEIPIFEQKTNIHQVTRIPTLKNENLVTLNIPTGFYSIVNKEIYKLENCVCIKEKLFICKENNNINENCLSEIYFNKLNTHCKQVILERHNYIIKIDFTSIKYIVSPFESEYKIECENEIINKNLKGIFLTNNCKINNVNDKYSVSFGKMIKLKIDSNKHGNIPTIKPIVKLTGLEPISLKPIIPINENNEKSHSVMNSLLIIVIFIIILIISIKKIYNKYLKRKANNAQPMSNSNIIET